MIIEKELVRRQDITSVQVKISTRAKLDKIGDIHKETYDDIIQRAIHQAELRKGGGIDYVVNTMIEDYKEIRYQIQMGDQTMLSDQVLTMLQHYIDAAEKAGATVRWDEVEIPRPDKSVKSDKQQKKVIRK